MSATMTPEGESVHFPHLARQLGLTDRQRSELLREQLVIPVNGSSRRGSPTLITPESAQNLRDARDILEWMKDNKRDAVGVTIIVILRLLLSGAMAPKMDPEVRKLYETWSQDRAARNQEHPAAENT